MELLTYEGTKHHHDNNTNITFMIVRIQVQIHKDKFRNYKEIEEGFDDVDEGEGGGDDRDRCHSLVRIPPLDLFRRVGFLDCCRDCGCSIRLLKNPKACG